MLTSLFIAVVIAADVAAETVTSASSSDLTLPWPVWVSIAGVISTAIVAMFQTIKKVYADNVALTRESSTALAASTAALINFTQTLKEIKDGR